MPKWTPAPGTLATYVGRTKAQTRNVIVIAEAVAGRMIVEAIGNAGRPRLPVRLMASLLYLKHSFNLSDEELVERWAENVQWQFFSGMQYYEPRLPCDPTQIGRFRRLLGEDGLEQLLKATIDCAVQTKAVRPAELERVIVDSTVQSKAIAHPVDSRLLEIARHKVVSAAKRCGISLKQTYAKEGKTLRRQAGGYAHAKQFKRLRKTVNRQRTILGVVMREVQRNTSLSRPLTRLVTRPAVPSAVAYLCMRRWQRRRVKPRGQRIGSLDHGALCEEATSPASINADGMQG
jgi:IS5 family transposase